MGRRPGRPNRRVAPARPALPQQRRPSGPKGLGGEQVEGRQAVRELLLAGRRKVREVLVATGDDGRLDGPVADIVELAGELRVAVKQVSRTKLDAAARTDTPQGVLARAAPLPEADLDDLARRGPGGSAPFLVAVDGVTDPGNLGALLRSAECNGATGVVLPRHRAVHVTPTVTKAAAGAIEHLPMTLVGGLPAALERLKGAGLWVVGLDGAGDTPIHELAVAADPVVLVLGAEGGGLSRLVRQRCDVLAAIPLRGQLASLNVAAAAAIATYEVGRRRV
jgi:23S rRNA (guanosine2251-2'-O)-methyltransferase